MRAVLLALATCLGLAVPVALATTSPVPVHPGQRIDMKVLLLSADGTEPGFGAWQAELDREGVPYTAVVAATAPDLTAAQLYDGDHAFYQAVILASGDLGHNVNNPNGTVSFLSALSDSEWAALATFERTFGIRQLSDYTAPTPAHGLTTVGGAVQDGATGTLTPAGHLAFPYLKGPVAIANDSPTVDEAFGYRATPVNAADWQTLVAGPDPGTAYLGIYTHPDDGREEMVMTVASNQFQNHDQLLRHGMLNWVTRGVYLGYERNYLELDVDDIFLGDDKWDPVNNVTDYDPAHAIRMTLADVANAVAWQQRTGLKLNMVYNMSGADVAGGNADPLLTAFRGVKNNFRWINHTYEHPNLDCQTAPYIASQLTQNQTRFNQLLGGVTAGLNDPTEAVTGEHSGIANTRPGNPGTIDPPSFDDAVGVAGGTLAAGTYFYGITATTAAGETTASVASAVVPASGSADLAWPSVCHATSYKLYKGTSATGPWTLLATLPPLSPAFTDAGAVDVHYADTGAVVAAAGAPPASNGAAIAPYPQNPAFIGAMSAAGIRTIASDASKEYPNPPTATTVADGLAGNYPKGAIFPDGATLAVPRYPSNVYYNVAGRADQLDEYNWIYTKPPLGGCVDIPAVTTCNTALTDWPTYLSNETRIMFGHLAGNDPRPHYFHQTNIAQSDPLKAATDTTAGGTLYAVIDTLLARYDAAYDRSLAPLVQLTPTQTAATLMQQREWTTARQQVQAWIQDGAVHVKNAGATAVAVPLTGTTVGAPYGGQRSGWGSVAPGAQLDVSPAEPALTAAPALDGVARDGSKLTATHGSWTGTAVSYAYQWQRCASAGCRSITGATDSAYTLTADDVDARVRVVVMAGNWVSSVSQATSAQSDVVAPAPKKLATKDESPATGGGHSGGGGSAGPGRTARLSLTKVKMTPRRFPVAHKSSQRGTRLDGSRITWRLNKAATVRLRFERRAGKRWVRVGTITRTSKAGAGVVRFRGRFGRHLLAPRSYRVVLTAVSGAERTSAKRVAFRVVKG